MLHYIYTYRVQLTIARKRRSVLGDYRHAHAGKGHRISINSDLNTYAFLITLLHEIAHLITFEKHGRKVSPHGREWKTCFGGILTEFTGKSIFPPEIEQILLRSLHNPAASSCADEKLLRALKAYDTQDHHVFFVEELAAGERFYTTDGRVFEKGEKIRKRYKCLEPASGKWYLFSPVYEVRKTLPV
ncbi:MAG: SprT-like domain-containing protein [Ferruginibacter sp.]